MPAILFTSWCTVVLTLVGVLLSACTAPSPPAGPSRPPDSRASTSVPSIHRLRAAYVSITGSMLPTWIAQDQGLYRKYNLDVELSYIAGAEKIAEALLGGDLDVGAAAVSAAMGPGLEGADLVMIASWTSRLGFSILSQPHVQAVGELRDKRVGIGRRRSNTEIWTATVLGQFGLQAERDYSILSIGGEAERLAALQNGAVDATVLSAPTNLIARRLAFRELLSYRDHALEYANAGLVTSRRYLRDHPEAVKGLLGATAEAVAIMLQQRETTLAVLSRYTQVDDHELLEETLAFESARTTRDLLPSPAGLRAALDELALSNPKAATADPESFVALEPLRQLNESGFIRALYP
jgi:NitT/TauT family transport system substrate-binding protein